MSNVPESAFPSDLLPQPCWRCKAIVVYVVRSPTREHGSRPIAVELAPAGVVGHVAIETSLIACGGCVCGYETNLPTRYRWHGPHCDLRVGEVPNVVRREGLFDWKPGRVWHPQLGRYVDLETL